MCHFSMMPDEHAVEKGKKSLLERKCHYLPKANTNLELGVYFFQRRYNCQSRSAWICFTIPCTQSAVQHVAPLLRMKPENK